MTHDLNMAASYIDLPWYRQLTGQRFSTSLDAAAYYLRKGESVGNWPNPLFDPIFYRQQFRLENESSLLHFLTHPAGRKCRPSRFFDLEWYEWQNPDFIEMGCGLLHYLKIGGKQYRDPCPEVDMTALARTHNPLGEGSTLAHLLSTGHINPGSIDAITEDDLILVRNQRELYKKIQFLLRKRSPEPVHGKNLLFVQCSKNTSFWSWFDKGRKRNWDLFLNCYGGHFADANNAEYVCEQIGTKFTGILNCWLQCPSLFDFYENIFFIDDDLVFNFDDISLFFHKMEDAMLDLAQPSLSANSQCVWPVFFNAQRSGTRKTNGVEIMMPALSRRSRNILLPYFIYSISGFGLDLLMAKLASAHNLNVGVIDDVIVHHEKIIDQSNGAYYEFLRRNHINSRYELCRVIKLFQTDRAFYQIN